MAVVQRPHQTTPDNAIEDATSDTYTPVAADATNGVILMVRASYTDGHDAMKMADGEAVVVVAEDTRNKPPAFEDQDTETKGIQNETATREVEENTKAQTPQTTSSPSGETDVPSDNVGGVLAATDPDPNVDPLIYTLSGADAGSFRVRDNGQIEVGAGTKLDYETRQTYMVTLTAEDSFDGAASIMVTITVTDLDEAPEISEGGLAISGMMSVDYAEDRRDAVATYMASGPESADASWTLGGDDAGDFNISSSGELTFKSAPDYENAADADTDNMYMVTVNANDGTYEDTRNVVVTVTDVVEAVVICDTLLCTYDTSGNDEIEPDEMRVAVGQFFADPPQLTTEEMRELVGIYFSS